MSHRQVELLTAEYLNYYNHLICNIYISDVVLPDGIFYTISMKYSCEELYGSLLLCLRGYILSSCWSTLIRVFQYLLHDYDKICTPCSKIMPAWDLFESRKIEAHAVFRVRRCGAPQLVLKDCMKQQTPSLWEALLTHNECLTCVTESGKDFYVVMCRLW